MTYQQPPLLRVLRLGQLVQVDVHRLVLRDGGGISHGERMRVEVTHHSILLCGVLVLDHGERELQEEHSSRCSVKIPSFIFQSATSRE